MFLVSAVALGHCAPENTSMIRVVMGNCVDASLEVVVCPPVRLVVSLSKAICRFFKPFLFALAKDGLNGWVDGCSQEDLTDELDCLPFVVFSLVVFVDLCGADNGLVDESSKVLNVIKALFIHPGPGVALNVPSKEKDRVDLVLALFRCKVETLTRSAESNFSECLSNLETEVVLDATVPVIDGLADFAVDVDTVDEKVVCCVPGEGVRVGEVGSHLLQFVPVCGNFLAVL